MGTNELTHYGILGMKWGVRRYQNKDGTLTNAGKKRYGDDGSKEKQLMDLEKKKRLKKVAIATGTILTVAAATAIYMNNKSAVDDFVKKRGRQLMSTVEKRSAAKVAANKAYAESHKSKIVKSASKLNRYKDYLSDQEVKDAVRNLQLTRDLHNLSQDNIRRGANYVAAFMGYGTAATTAYGLAKSSLVKDIQNTAKRNSKKG